MTELSLRRPDDWHLHVRDGVGLRAVIGFTAARFGRAIIMPNLKPPVTTTELALAYRQRILDALPAGSLFQPLMTLYLTDRTDPKEVDRARASGFVHGFKLYPAGATTNSDAGVTRIENVYGVLERMSELGVVFQVHGEVTHSDVDVFDREARFVSDTLAPLIERFASLKAVLEHITTREAAEFVASARPGVAATITAHHLLYNRSDIFRGGIRPDLYCLPILKRESHRRALLAAATSNNPRFFLGTDSAPHPKGQKYAACGCAGIYTAHAALPLYAEAFEAAGALDRLEAFASFFGPDFYGLPRNHDRIELVREAWQVPEEYELGQERLVPLRAGQNIAWRVVPPATA